MLVSPIIIAPAARTLLTTAASSLQTCPTLAFSPHVAVNPYICSEIIK